VIVSPAAIYWLRWCAAVLGGIVVLVPAYAVIGMMLPHITVGFEETRPIASIALPVLFSIGVAMWIAPKKK